MSICSNKLAQFCAATSFSMNSEQASTRKIMVEEAIWMYFPLSVLLVLS